MIYRARHITRYTYQGPVAHCLSEARLTPREIAGRQRVIECTARVTPEPAACQTRLDYFGNTVTAFTVLEAHDRLVIDSSSVVETERPRESLDLSPSWEETRRMLAERPDQTLLDASEFAWESPFVPLVAEASVYAEEVFGPGRPVVDTARQVMGRIFADFTYAPASTGIETPLDTVMWQRRGVCQDFAHVMIAVLRSRGLAARYVSGYLRSGQGAEASHAWVSVFVPGSGWVDFDPTNNVMPSEDHLTLAWGRDFGDVTPVKGVATGGGGHTVEVEVRVTPA